MAGPLTAALAAGLTLAVPHASVSLTAGAFEADYTTIAGVAHDLRLGGRWDRGQAWSPALAVRAGAWTTERAIDWDADDIPLFNGLALSPSARLGLRADVDLHLGATVGLMRPRHGVEETAVQSDLRLRTFDFRFDIRWQSVQVRVGGRTPLLDEFALVGFIPSVEVGWFGDL